MLLTAKTLPEVQHLGFTEFLGPAFNSSPIGRFL